ncbi:hypothetical protein FQN49_004474 [Arthroderma sp. PD_2]|nr:hypothetical protein FQN49_004474 [Arthroderma sp. PD_2]
MDPNSQNDTAAGHPVWTEIVDEHADHGITVEPHGVERGDKRTALSQRRNLYFVAYSSNIHVYQPSRGQVLGSRPALILTPKMARPDSPGYIAPNIPHAINHIIVGDLGSDEILLLATDSGNVAAYRTERIYWAIEDRRAEDTDPVQVGLGVECFFSEWVSQSAWALAIHKFARMIAVSSNTTTITIFAFALVDDTEMSHPTQGASFTSGTTNPKVYNNDWIHIVSLSEFVKLRSWSRQRRRSQNIRLSLLGHIANIPNVSFLNCDLDPHGDWLVSTDINNKLLVWKIWERFRPVHHWDFYPLEDHHFDDLLFDDRQRGWNVLAVDPRSFRTKKDLLEACGGPPHRFPNKSAPYDLSFLAGRVHDATQYYDFFSPRTSTKDEHHKQGPPPDELFPLTHSDDSDADSSELFDPMDSEPAKSNSPVNKGVGAESNGPSALQVGGGLGNSASLDIQIPIQNPAIHSIQTTAPPGFGSNNNNQGESDEDDQSEDEYDEDEDDDQDEDEENDDYDEDEEDEDEEHVHAQMHVNTIPSSNAMASNADVNMADEMESEEGEDDADSSHDGSSGSNDQSETDDVLHSSSHADGDAILGPDEEGALNKLDDTGGPLTDDHPDPGLFTDFPVLHFSESHIRMLPGPFSHGPSVIFRAALSQVVTNPVQSIEATDRFNMVLQIPDLGVVIAASQKGRVAIMGLTEVAREGKVFRIDRIVPFASQERCQLRPLCPLLGIAVSPVVSHLIPFETPPDDYEDVCLGRNTSEFDGLKFNNHTNMPDSSQSSNPLSQGDGTGAQPRPFGDRQGKSNLPKTLYIQGPFSEGPKKENWHGIEYSRRYRLFLTYCDHTIMHYELYYDWPKELRGPEAQMTYDKNEPFILRP